MVETIRDRLDKESDTLVVFFFWLSVMFKPLGESQVPIWKTKYTHSIRDTEHIIRHTEQKLQKRAHRQTKTEQTTLQNSDSKIQLRNVPRIKNRITLIMAQIEKYHR